MKAFLFGHYDSRGGASLAIAETREAADKKYAETFGIGTEDGWTESEEEAAEDTWRLCDEDFMDEVELTLHDVELSEISHIEVTGSDFRYSVNPEAGDGKPDEEDGVQGQSGEPITALHVFRASAPIPDGTIQVSLGEDAFDLMILQSE